MPKISRRGYAGTRLTDVADQAEIQAPAIYYYFPSRDDLIEEVIWTGIARTREHMAEVLDALPARIMVLGALNWAAEWWNSQRGSLDTVVRTAQTLVRHGLGVQAASG